MLVELWQRKETCTMVGFDRNSLRVVANSAAADNISCQEEIQTVPDRAYSHFGQPFTILSDKDMLSNDLMEQLSVYTLGACLDLCSVTPSCTAFSWSDECTCWVKTSSLNASAIPLDGTYSGFTPSEAFISLDNFICPYPNLSLQNASNRASFKVICGSDFPGDDFSPDYVESTPSYGQYAGFSQEVRGFMAWHTDTYDECLEMCATSHPICRTFVFAPEYSWINCFLKNVPGQTPAGLSPSRIYGGVLQEPEHQARSKWKCENGTVQTVKNAQGQNVDFKLSCNDFRPPKTGSQGIIKSRHENSIDACLVACANTQSNTLEESCIAVMFDEGLGK
jgi:hypothetical protein